LSSTLGRNLSSCRPIGDFDSLIAAQALARDLIVVTNNVDEFERVPDLRIENWAE
jgi:tRNA(fMet)-specific endonuclease VapC